MSAHPFEAVCRLADVREGAMRSFVVGGREIVICHARAGLFAVDNVCTHAYARLSEGPLRGTRLICPLHGACFDVRDGSVLGGPAELPLAAHALRIVDGSIEVAIEV
jgi:nitrite reductase/ring-hydroxylating ferredoxin subunit